MDWRTEEQLYSQADDHAEIEKQLTFFSSYIKNKLTEMLACLTFFFDSNAIA